MRSFSSAGTHAACSRVVESSGALFNASVAVSAKSYGQAGALSARTHACAHACTRARARSRTRCAVRYDENAIASEMVFMETLTNTEYSVRTTHSAELAFTVHRRTSASH